MYLKLTNGKPEKYSIGQFRKDNSQISFPKQISNDLLSSFGVYPYTSEMPEYDNATKKLGEQVFVERDGAWFLTYRVVDKTQDEVNAVRIAELKRLLEESDYKAMPDYDKDNTEVLAQRQLWRDEIRQLEAELSQEV